MIRRAYHRAKVMKCVNATLCQFLEGAECSAASKAVGVALLRLSGNTAGRQRLNRYLDLPLHMGVKHEDAAVTLIDMAITELKSRGRFNRIDNVENIIHSLTDVLDYTITRRGVVIQPVNGAYRDAKADVELDRYFRGRRA